MPSDPTPLAEHVERLRSAFADAVRQELEHGRGEVLDIGAGWGRVSTMLRDSGVGVSVTESTAKAVEGLRRQGFPAQIARAERLPFADSSVDVVAMRHLLHHLDDPVEALREALRIARRAVVFAEPVFAETAPGRAALEFDLRIKRLERRTGRVHEPNLGESQIRGAVAATGCELEPVFEFVGLDAFRELTELDSEVERFLDDVGTAGDRAWFTRFREQVVKSGIARNGSLLVRLRLGPEVPR